MLAMGGDAIRQGSELGTWDRDGVTAGHLAEAGTGPSLWLAALTFMSMQAPGAV